MAQILYVVRIFWRQVFLMDNFANCKRKSKTFNGKSMWKIIIDYSGIHYSFDMANESWFKGLKMNPTALFCHKELPIRYIFFFPFQFREIHRSFTSLHKALKKFICKDAFALMVTLLLGSERAPIIRTEFLS